MADSAHITTMPVPFNAMQRLRPFGCPPGVAPSIWRQALRKRTEATLAIAEALLAALDEMDGDPDLEPSVSDIGYYVYDDREGDPIDDGEFDDADREPNLGWGRTGPAERQTLIATERDHDEREVDHDFEEVNEDGGNILDYGHDAQFGGGTFVPPGGGNEL